MGGYFLYKKLHLCGNRNEYTLAERTAVNKSVESRKE